MRNSTLTTHHCQKAKPSKCLPFFYTMQSSFAAVFCSQPKLSRIYHERLKHMTNKKTVYVCMLTLVTALLVLPGCAVSSSSGTPSGIKADVGVDVASKTITLGILSPYSGPVADPVGKPLARGVEVFFKSINDHGGINGYKVKFIEKDSQYNPQIQVEQYNQIHTQVLMIADSLGTAPTFAIKNLATSDHMLVSAATLSSALAREKYLILVGTPYRLQVENV